VNSQSQTESSGSTPEKRVPIKVFGVGNAGIKIMEQMLKEGHPDLSYVAISTEASALGASAAPEKVHLETKLLRGLGTGGDPERGEAAAEEQAPRLKALCEKTDVVFILAGLGGGAGTGISPVLARVAREAGALVLAFVSTPFQCEGRRRHEFAREGLEDLKQSADGVICQRNERAFKLIDENTSVIETFKITNNLLAEGIRGVLRLLTTKNSLIEIHLSDICALLRDRHAESHFAVAEAMGPNRSREVLDKLLAHPMLDGGEMLADSEAVLVSVMGGPDLAMGEVNRLMEQLNRHCEHGQVIMGAAVDDAFREKLSVTLIVARKTPEQVPEKAKPNVSVEGLDTQLLRHTETVRPGSRFVPPPPSLPQDKLEQLLARKASGTGRVRKKAPKMRQGNLPLEIVSKGRFDKSEPTIHKGEDLDVPTYIRRGIALN